MTILTGNDFSLSVDIAGLTHPVGEVRSVNLTMNAALVDASNVSSGAWRTLLSDASPRDITIRCNGVFTSSEVNAEIRTLFMTGQLASWSLETRGDGTLTGPFEVVTLDLSGEVGSMARFKMTLASAGPVTFSTANSGE